MTGEKIRHAESLAHVAGEPCPARKRHRGKIAPRCSEALGSKLDPKVRAFADHLAKAVAESVLRDIRAGRWGKISAEPATEG